MKNVTALESLFVMYSYFLMEFLLLKADFFWLPFLKSISTKRKANNYLSKVNNKNTRTRSELCSKLTTKKLGRHHCSRSDVFIFNFEHVSCPVSIVNFDQMFLYWEMLRRIYKIKSLSYLVSPSFTNPINSQLFFIVNAGLKKTTMR